MVTLTGAGDVAAGVSAGADVQVPEVSVGGGADLPTGQVSVEAPSAEVAVEETIQAEGAKQVESGFGFSMPGLSVSYYTFLSRTEDEKGPKPFL